MTDDLLITPLRIIADDRGAVMHMLRCDAPHFKSFGEIYFSKINPGVIKAWKRHKKMTLNLAAIEGSVRLVLYDDRTGESTNGAIQEIIFGPDNYVLVTVPPMIWYGFACIGDTSALLANCASIPHDPEEAENLPASTGQIPYAWP